MIRLLTIAAVAALIATPASARSIKIDIAGKSNAEVQASLASAVRKVCVSAAAHATFRHQAYAACVKETAAAANAQLAATQGRASQVASK